MKTSNETNNLVKALFEFQGKVNAVKKTAKNDHFHSSYADLSSILTMCTDTLMKKVHRLPLTFFCIMTLNAMTLSMT